MKRFDFNDNAATFWKSSTEHFEICDMLINTNKSLKIQSFRNKDEDKYAILPLINKVDSKTEHYVISIGVGTDIQSEIGLRNATEKLGINTKFIGADPMFMFNFPLFSSIGTFFPLAIGGSNGYSTAHVQIENGYYKDTDVFHVDLSFFITKLLKIRKIDHLWIDNEWSEYELLSYFYKNGVFDKNGVRICQVNIEIHLPSESQKEIYKKFIESILKDKRYAILKQIEFAGHHRVYMFNFADSYCIQKYIQM